MSHLADHLYCAYIYCQTLSGMDLGCSWLQWKFGELKGGCVGRCYPRGLSRFVVWVLVNGWVACKMVQQIRLCIHICVCCQYLSMVKSSNFHANIIFLRCTCMHIELYMLHQRFVYRICFISLRLTRRPLLRLRLAFASPLSAISNRKISSTSSTTSSTITITTAALAPAAAVPS